MPKDLEKRKEYDRRYSREHRAERTAIARNYRHRHRERVREMQNKSNARGSRERLHRLWEGWETALLLLPDITDVEIAKRTQRTVSAIRAKRGEVEKPPGFKSKQCPRGYVRRGVAAPPVQPPFPGGESSTESTERAGEQPEGSTANPAPSTV